MKIIETISRESKTVCLAAFAFAFLALPAEAGSLSGRVVRVLDGDTIEVLVDRQPIRVRLASIDAPERGQPFGTASRQSLADIVAGRSVKVQSEGRDRYGRVLGDVIVGGRSANAAQVEAGMAWVYRQYSWDPRLLALENHARASRRGLWRDPRPTPPWDYRKQK